MKKIKPRGRAGGRPRKYGAPLARLCVRVRADQKEWLRENGNMSEQVIDAIDLYREKIAPKTPA